MFNFILLNLIAGVLAIWEGFVVSVLWGWFMVPMFHLPPMRIPYAIGIALLVGMLVHRTRKEGDEPETAMVIAYGIVVPLVCLGFGWIASFAR